MTTETRNRDLTEQEYDEMLDEIYPPVEIGYLTFDVSRILSELDPIAYRCGMADMEGEEYKVYICDVCGSEFEDADECEVCEECCEKESTK